MSKKDSMIQAKYLQGKKYKAVLSEMMKNGNGAMFTNVQAIKNLMSQYDKNGDWIDPNTGLTGLAVTDENRNSYYLHLAN